MANRRGHWTDSSVGIVLSAVCIGFVVHSFIRLPAHRQRLAAYRADSHCGTAVIALDTGTAGQRCTVGRVVIGGRWKESCGRGCIAYNVVISEPGGGTDSLRLVPVNDRYTWEQAASGDTAFVERFAAAPTDEPAHITQFRVASAYARTSWNPELGADNDAFVILFLGGLVSPLLGFLTYRLMKQQRIAAFTPRMSPFARRGAATERASKKP